MPRRAIEFVQGGYYHIYNRGAGQHAIFREEENYRYLLRLLKQVAQECEVTVIAYCLLPNHYHWLVRQDGETPAGKVPTWVFCSYTRAFNKAYGRSGTLFEGRFKAKQVTDDAYLKHLCRYIHANPVRHGLADAVELWPYSNYLEWVNKRPGKLVDRNFVRRFFPEPSAYEQYVRAYLTGGVQLLSPLAEYLMSL